MPITFTCPHCHKPLRVKDELAGKKGPCPACKQVLTVPRPAEGVPAAPKAAAPPAPAPPQPPPPAPAPADVEAEIAALLSDGHQGKAEARPPEFIDFPCPYCDEPLHLDAALAGKKTPCPSCRRIISVPLPKVEKKDWRTLDTRLPSGAQRPTEPVPEGAWSSTAASRVSQETLVQAEVIPKTRVQLSTGQKVRRGLLLAGGVAAVAVVALVGWKWWAAGRQERALKNALAYAASPEAAKRIGAEGQAAIRTGAGEFHLRGRKPQCGPEAGKEMGQAFQLLSTSAGADRDFALTELARAQVDLGGGPADLEREMRLKWDGAGNTMNRVQASLTAVRASQARLEALRGVAARLRERGEVARVIPLTTTIYSAADEDQAEALAVVGLDLLAAGSADHAADAADRALAVYQANREKRPRLRAAVVALALALKKPAPKPEKGSVADETEELVGQAEGLARQGQWDQARARAQSAGRYPSQVQFRALVGLAAAAADGGADKADVETAARAAETAMPNRPDMAWQLLRLTQAATKAGLPDDTLYKVAGVIAVPSVRGQAQLGVLRARLAASRQVVDAGAADRVEPKSLAHLLAREELARHNVRLDSGWAKLAQGWEGPARAFGSLGVALGLQGDK